MKIRYISFCGMMAALATVLMLVGYFPYLTYAVPCVASLPIMIVVIELDKKSAFFTYLASLLPVFLFCEPESKMVYVCLTGVYPVLKALFESGKNWLLEWMLKLAFFAAGTGLIYLLSTYLFSISFSDLGEFGRYGVFAFLFVALLVFIAYDFCIFKMAEFYLYRFHSLVKRMLK